jgi:hypothetical protein
MFRKQLKRMALATVIGGGLACVSFVGADPAKADGNTFYGIDNDNNILEVNPLLKFTKIVNEVGLTLSDCATTEGCLAIPAGSNGIAYDTARDHLFFFYNPNGTGAQQSYDLRFWNRKSSGIGSLKTIDLSGQFGPPVYIPANAAYYNDALWYFDGGNTTTILNQLSLSYNPAGDDIVDWALTSFDLNNYASPSYSPGGYGDIAINVTNGLLYGSTTNGNYFSVNLNQLGDTANAVYTDLGTIYSLQGTVSDITDVAQRATGLQLSFNADYSKLYGTRFCNAEFNCAGYTLDGQPIQPAIGDGLFFEITDYATGDSTTERFLTDADLLYASSPGFRDLGGATANAIVPGPLPVLGIGAAFGWSRRLRRRIKPVGDR